jgi:DNA-binding NarL/FixJ family response regulator
VNGVVRLALVDHQPLFARGLELLLPAVTASRVRVVAITDDATLASGMVRRHLPDLAVVDLGLPEPGGLRAIAAIRRAEPRVPVVAMADGSDSDDADDMQAVAALRAGAMGFLRKTAEPEDLVTPILAVVEGWVVLPRRTIERLLGPAANPPADPPTLSLAERALWRMVARGLTTAAIAGELHVSERTAKRLLAALFRRLQVSSRTEAAALAGRTGLLEPGS